MAKYQGKHTTQANKTPSRRKSRRGSRIIPILAAAVFVYAAARLAMGFFYDIKLDREQAELKAAVISTPVPVEDWYLPLHFFRLNHDRNRDTKWNSDWYT